MLEGNSLIGSTTGDAGAETFRSFNPVGRTENTVTYRSATLAELDRACALAEAAVAPFASLSRELRARFLERIAERLAAGEEAVVAVARGETGLPEMRLRGELGRTTGQLRLFAQVLRRGAYLDIRVDEALPDRAPPRPDLRVMNRPLGPVAVFGASNFPLAFSVAGGDTASALAAGCPVVVKAHPAHPGTSELVGRAIQASVADCGLPEGVFSLLFERGVEIGQALVADPRITAVGFTGSRSAGLAIASIAKGRAVPIPVYAEMSSINPVVLMPGALAERGEAIGNAFAQAQSLGAGQFCTNPGLLLAVEGSDTAAFLAGVADAYRTITPGTMLTPGIHQAYCRSVERLEGHPDVVAAASGNACEGLVSRPALFTVSAAAFLADPSLSEEVFGAASLLIECVDLAEIAELLGSLEGQLTGAIHTGPGDPEVAGPIVQALEQRAGRVLFNGFGTGVEVCDAMVHGGPYPATSDVRTTSVGSLAIARFVRPVCYQDVPQTLLPADLQDAALEKLPHLKNGQFQVPEGD